MTRQTREQIVNGARALIAKEVWAYVDHLDTLPENPPEPEWDMLDTVDFTKFVLIRALETMMNPEVSDIFRTPHRAPDAGTIDPVLLGQEYTMPVEEATKMLAYKEMARRFGYQMIDRWIMDCTSYAVGEEAFLGMTEEQLEQCFILWYYQALGI